MQKIFLNGLGRPGFPISFLLSILVTSTPGTSLVAQDTRIIRLKQERLTAKPVNFHIAAVKDDRADTSTIGSVRAGIFSRKEVSLNLPGGASQALDEFLRANLAKDEHTFPIVLHISQLEVAEQTGRLKSASEVRMTIGFYGGWHNIKEYKGRNNITAGD